MGFFSFRLTPLLHFTFQGRQRAFDNFSERWTMHEFAPVVSQTFTIDNVMEMVVGALRNTRIEENSTAGFREDRPLRRLRSRDSP